MTIDEVIERERKKAEMYRCVYECERDYYGKDIIDDYTNELDCIKHMRVHEQLADWLEELKVYQQHEIICNKGYNAGYNKAIDDFVAFTKEHEYKYGNADITSIVIGFNKFIAEHLKVGGSK